LVPTRGVEVLQIRRSSHEFHARTISAHTAFTGEEIEMIHQLRIYEIFEENKAVFHARFRDHAARIMQRHGFQIIAMWEAKTEKRTEFVYLLRWPNERTKTDAWAAFMADQEWEEIKRATRDHGSLVGEIEDRLLVLTDYSPELPIFGHLSFGVSDLERAIAFYDAALAPLGLARVWTKPHTVGYGYPAARGELLALKKQSSQLRPPGPGFHIAFNAMSHAAVDAFHSAALRAGGTDNGRPGLRPHYGPTYYAAFVIDPDGHPIEAVCQRTGT
jgi:catechol 2,3-dioxygenase-like lactoylglutathione lyase family enzyme/heme-degrading monooxygenase HmoA